MKKFVAFLLAVALLMSLTACGGAKEPATSPDAPDVPDYKPL